MKYKIEIPKPCSEDWEKMSIIGKNKFCASCQKTVHDFTTYSQTDLLKVLNSEKKVCGRFRKSQLAEAYQHKNPSSAFSRLGLILGLTAIFGISTPAIAQRGVVKVEVQNKAEKEKLFKQKVSDSITIRGEVLDGTGMPLPGVKIVLKGTELGTQTDFDGNFEITLLKERIREARILQFSFLGFMTKEIEINDASKNINIGLTNLEEDFMGEVVVVGGAFARPSNIFHRIGNFFRRLF